MFDPCVYFAISSLSARVRSLGKICATFSRLREFALHFPTNLVCTKKGRPRGGGVLLGILDGGVPPDSLNPDPISDQKNFQTWPPRNCIMLERQQRVFKSVLNFFFFIHLELKLPIRSYSPSKTIPVFRPKRHQNPTLWSGKYLYGLCKRVPSPPPSPGGEGEQNGW